MLVILYDTKKLKEEAIMKKIVAVVFIVGLLFYVSSGMTAEPNSSKTRIVADQNLKIRPKEVEALKKRVGDYWNLRIKNNYTKAFDYEDPETKKKYNITLEEYLSSKANVKYEGIKISEIRFERPDYAKVTLIVKYTFEWLEKINDEKDIIDKWVKRKDGKWYRIFTTNIGQTPLEQ